MGSVKVGKMRERHEESKRGGDFINFDEGDMKVYIHGTCRDDDDNELTEGLNYIPITVHYGLGKDRKFAVCLDPVANPILKHPWLRTYFKKKGLKLDGKCPVCAEIQSGSMSPDEANDARPQTKYLFGMTPLAKRSKPSEEWKEQSIKPGIALVGRTIYEGIVELYSDVGDVSELTSATLARIHREGKGKNDTKYKVVADAETTKTPLNIKKNKALLAALTKALAIDGDCDLFRAAAGLVKSGPEVEAMMSGVKTDDSDDDDDADDDDVETDDEADLDKADVDEDDDEDALPEPKKTKKKAVVEDEEDDEDEDEEEDEPVKAKPKSSSKKSKPVVEEDEDDEDDEDDEPVKAKSKPAVKSKPKVEEPEDDEDEEEEDDEEEPAPKVTKKATKKVVVSDDEALDELDAELDRMSKKKGKAK